MTAATAAEIASIRRRYLWMAGSAALIDAVFTLVFILLTGAWGFAPRSFAIGLTFMLGANLVLADRLFRPIQDFLEGRAAFEDVQRRVTQLPLLTARNVGALAAIVTIARLSASHLLSDPGVDGVPKPTAADFVTLCLILPIFYFTYAYFGVSDYLSKLCAFIFRHHGRNLELFFGSYTTKLVVALTVISIAPLASIIVDLSSYDGERLEYEIANDVVVALMAVAVVAYFIGRSLLRPIRILSRAMAKVAGGDLEVRVPVTSNDEVGELTGQFNRMVEGLRERERIRETFGRYVDESVAAAILARKSDAQGEIAEATILFTDIAGFTTIAEHLGPTELVGVLNEYLETVLEPIRRNGGVVNTFIGSPRSTCRLHVPTIPAPQCRRRSTSSARSAVAPSAISAWHWQPGSASAPVP
jgi:HAMP domain-containing protein